MFIVLVFEVGFSSFLEALVSFSLTQLFQIVCAGILYVSLILLRLSIYLSLCFEGGLVRITLLLAIFWFSN